MIEGGHTVAVRLVHVITVETTGAIDHERVDIMIAVTVTGVGDVVIAGADLAATVGVEIGEIVEERDVVEIEIAMGEEADAVGVQVPEVTGDLPLAIAEVSAGL